MAEMRKVQQPEITGQIKLMTTPGAVGLVHASPGLVLNLCSPLDACTPYDDFTRAARLD
jgi:hypothetical protein